MKSRNLMSPFLLLIAITGCGVTRLHEVVPPSIDVSDAPLPEVQGSCGCCGDRPGFASSPPPLDLLGDCAESLPDEDCAPIVSVPQMMSPVELKLHDLGPGESCPGCPECQPHPDQPWGRPGDEYVCDGGDRRTTVRVRSNWQLDGLDLEDTVGHFDTLAGETGVAPSNRACVYAPRFAAVRQVTNVMQRQSNEAAANAREMMLAVNGSLHLEPEAVKQPIGTVRAVGTSIGTTFEELQKGLLVEELVVPIESRNQQIPIGNLQVLEYGVMAGTDIPILYEATAAAQVWSAVEMAQVLIDGQLAYEQKGVGQAQAEVVYQPRDGDSRLRLIKLASRCDAKSGEEVEFTIRFDNVGDLLIGNVTVVDKLTPRLKFVEDSEDCTVPGEFLAESDGEALVLRWEIEQPLRPGEGGVISFRCRVN